MGLVRQAHHRSGQRVPAAGSGMKTPASRSAPPDEPSHRCECARAACEIQHSRPRGDVTIGKLNGKFREGTFTVTAGRKSSSNSGCRCHVRCPAYEHAGTNLPASWPCAVAQRRAGHRAGYGHDCRREPATTDVCVMVMDPVGEPGSRELALRNRQRSSRLHRNRGGPGLVMLVTSQVIHWRSIAECSPAFPHISPQGARDS
jgi:hypothetical protein